MINDVFGLPLSGASPQAREAYNIYAGDWVGHGPRVRSVIDAAEAEPCCASLNAHAAAVCMALESSSGFRAARQFLVRARKQARTVTKREQIFISAIYKWWRGDARATLNLLRQIVSDNPSDVVTAKWAQYHAFNQGDAPALLSTAQALFPAHRDTPQAWSMLAFAHEQMNDLSSAERSAQRALELLPSEPWAQHALAHVMETQGKFDEGIRFLTRCAPGWADRSLFIREHNYWHLALFHLDRDDAASALRIFDQHLWGEWTDFAQEQIGAISALWRLELRGAHVGERWRPITEKVLERWHEHILPFNDVHYVYALARAGRESEVSAFLASMERHGASDRYGIWDSLALPLARGLSAYVKQEFGRAADLIGQALPRLHLIGGSHAQRDIFVQTWIDASLHAGHQRAVESVLRERAHARPLVQENHRLMQRLAKAA